MPSSHSTTNHEPDKTSLRKRDLLALFSCLGILFGFVIVGALFLNHRSLQAHRKAEENNKISNDWLNLFVLLGRRAYVAHEAAYSIFKDRDLGKARKIESLSSRRFQEVWTRALSKLDDMPSGQRGPLADGLDKIKKAMQRLHLANENVFQEIEHANVAEAAKKLHAVDTAYAKLLGSVGDVIVCVDDLRNEQSRKAGRAELVSLQTFYYTLGVLLGLVVLVLVWSGRYLVKQLDEEMQERQAALAKVEQAEGRLEEMLMFHRTIIDSAHSIIISTDLSGVIQSVNVTAEKMLGYGAEELVVKATPIIFHDYEELMAKNEELSEELGLQIEPGMDTFFTKARMDEAYQNEWNLRRKDGTFFPVHLSVSAVRDPDGNLIGVIGVGTDITERRRSQEKLKAEQQKYRHLFEWCPIAIWEEDFSGIGELMQDLRNEGVEDLRAYLTDRPEIISEVLRRVKIRDMNNAALLQVEAESPEQLEANVDQILATHTHEGIGFGLVQLWNGKSTIEFESRSQTIRGNWIDQLIRLVVAEENGTLDLSNVIVSSIDITERKKAEAEREKFFALVENSTEFIGMATLEGEVLYINPAGRKMIGLAGPKAALATKIPDYFDGYHAAHMQDVILPLVGQEGKWWGENELRHFQTGENIPVEQIIWTVQLSAQNESLPPQQCGEPAFAAQQRGAGGAADNAPPQLDHPAAVRGGAPPVCLATVIRDLRAKKKHEAELQEALVAANAASKAKTDFLANISHEVRTPMTAILGYAEMLLDPALPPEKVASLLHSMRRNGNHLLLLISDVLDLTKIEAGKLDLELSPCSPWQIVLDATSTLMIRATEKGVELQVTPAGPLPSEILVDPLRLRQILVNLVNNAIKFTPPGKKIEVRLLAEKDRPSEEDGTSCDWLCFEVEDEGIGMTPEQMSRLFRPFEQGDASTTKNFGGTGLGLSISKQLATLLGGDIHVKSELDKGSRFTLEIPVRCEGPVTWVSPDELQPGSEDFPRSRGTVGFGDGLPPLPRSLTGRKILLADDSEDNQRVLTYHLEKLGCEVDLASNGEVAVEKALGGNHDLVLMDMAMPKLDGYGAASCLRNHHYDKPIVALTAHALSGDRERCIRAGCSDYLTKPIAVPVLRNTLERLLLSQSGPDQEAGPYESFTPPLPEVIYSTQAGDTKFLPLLCQYVQNLPNMMNQFREHLSAGNREAIRALAHQMKSSSGMYGYPALSETAKLIESAIDDEQDIELISELLNEVADLIRRIERAVPGP